MYYYNLVRKNTVVFKKGGGSVREWLEIFDKFLENLLKMLTIAALIVQIWHDLNSKH